MNASKSPGGERGEHERKAIAALIAETCGRIATLTSESVLRSVQLELELLGGQACEAIANGATGRRAFAKYAAVLRTSHAVQLVFLDNLEKAVNAATAEDA